MSRTLISKTLFSGTLLVAAVMLLTTNLATAAEQSAFIEDMPTLEAQSDGIMRWQKEGLKASDYTKLLIQPISLFIHPESEYKGFDADEMKAVADRLRHALVDALEPDFPVVSKAGAGVMVVRIAITDLRLKKKKRGLLGYTPIGFVAGAVTSSAGDNVNLVDAGLEWEFLDGSSGERIGVAVDKKALESGKGDWNSIEAALKKAAERFRKRVESEQAQ
jgi:hypothetical protein